MARGEDAVSGTDSGRSREIAADIDRTRDALDRTIDALVGKLTPSQVLGEAVHIFRSGSSTVLGRVMTTAREHPVPATIVAAGLGMILWERSGGSAPARGYTPDIKAYDTEGSGRGGIGRVKDKAQEVAAEVGEKLEEVKESVGEEARQLKEQARRQVKEAKIGFWQTMDRQPLVVGGIALALGAAVALLVPRTAREDELMGEARERVKDRAEEIGRQVLDRGKEVVRSTAEVLREEAREQGLAPDQLAQKVRTVARGAEQAAVQKAQETMEPVGAGAEHGPGGSNRG
jgi:hypothetical protein